MSGDMDALLNLARKLEEPACCPHCTKPLSAEMVAQVQAKSEVSIRIVPNPGEMLDSATVGGTIVDFGKLLVSFGKSAGVATVALVKSLTTDADGAMTVTLLITRGPEAEARLQKRRRAKRSQ